MSRITLTAASRIGCVRSNNEDMVLAFDKLVRSEAYETEFMTENYERYILAIADGMGGHRAGEVASEMVLSDLLNREGRLVTDSWYYSSELRVVSPVPLYQLGLALFPRGMRPASSRFR